jgi:flavin-binding protein dodecin
MMEPINGGVPMPGTYKKIEIVGTSPVGFSEAVAAGVAEASRTVRHMDWFEVAEQRGHIKDNNVVEYQVVLKVGFKIEH